MYLCGGDLSLHQLYKRSIRKINKITFLAVFNSSLLNSSWIKPYTTAIWIVFRFYPVVWALSKQRLLVPGISIFKTTIWLPSSSIWILCSMYLLYVQHCILKNKLKSTGKKLSLFTWNNERITSENYNQVLDLVVHTVLI